MGRLFRTLGAGMAVDSLLTLLFYVAALANVGGMLLLSGGQIGILFRSYYGSFIGLPGILIPGASRYSLAALYPNVFSPEGCVAVILWGLAYAAVAQQYQRLPWLCFVFALEKAFYTLTWVNWNFANAARWADVAAAADP